LEPTKTTTVTRLRNAVCLFLRQAVPHAENAATLVGKKSRFRTKHSTECC